MINTLKLTNFQSHKRSKLELSPGVNALIGPSDNGKTAVLRALYWAFTNRPSGDAFISHWARNEKEKQTDISSIEINTSLDKIIRFKDKDNNGYDLINNENIEKFRAIGVDVPEKILQLLNLNEVNLHRQLDPPFLISASAGEVARFFNKIIDLTVIDNMLSAIESKRRKNNQDIKVTEKQINQLSESLKAMGWIENAEKLIRKMERISEKIESKKNIQNTIRIEITEYLKYFPIIELIKNTIKIEPVINEYEKLFEINHKLYLTKEDLKDSSNLYKSYTEKIDEYKSGIVAEKTIDKTNDILNDIFLLNNNKNILKETIDNYNQLLKNNRNLPDFILTNNLINKASEISEKLENIKNDMEDLEDNIFTYRRHADTIKRAKEKIQDFISELPDICPTCGGKLEK